MIQKTPRTYEQTINAFLNNSKKRCRHFWLPGHYLVQGIKHPVGKKISTELQQYSLDLEMLHASVVDHLPRDSSLGREIKVNIDQEQDNDGDIKCGQTFPT